MRLVKLLLETKLQNGDNDIQHFFGGSISSDVHSEITFYGSAHPSP